MIYSIKTPSHAQYSPNNNSYRHRDKHCKTSLRTSISWQKEHYKANIAQCNTALGWRQNRHFLQKHVCSASAEHEAHASTLSPFCRMLDTATAINFSCISNNYKKEKSIRKPAWVTRSVGPQFPFSPKLTKVASLVQHLHSRSTPWQNTLLSLRMFSVCPNCTYAKKIKIKIMHTKKTRQTKAGIEKSHSDALSKKQLAFTLCTCARIVHQTVVGTVWCTLWCVHVSISLCETAVFFYTKKKKKKREKLATKKRSSTIVIYNFLDAGTNNDKRCTDTRIHDDYCAKRWNRGATVVT